jgi:hypothetical protein
MTGMERMGFEPLTGVHVIIGNTVTKVTSEK